MGSLGTNAYTRGLCTVPYTVTLIHLNAFYWGYPKMPQYYFHIKRGQMIVLDHEGAELVSHEAAVEEATRRRQEIVGSDGTRGVIVFDDNWQTVFELNF